jgi:hypothetical protein
MRISSEHDRYETKKRFPKVLYHLLSVVTAVQSLDLLFHYYQA